MFKKYLLAASLAFCMAGSAVAQEYEKGELKSYSFVEVQGGVQSELGGPDFTKQFTPAVGFNFGHFFTPEVGARLAAHGWESKGGFKSIDQYYKFKYVSTNLDLLINLTNVFSKTKSHLLNLMLVGGAGLNYCWDNDELLALQQTYPTQTNAPLRWSDDRLTHNLRAGLRLETNVTKPVGVSLEVLANNTDDRFNSRTNSSDDWYVTAMLGISVRFGHKYHQKLKEAPTPAPVVEPEPEPEPEPIVEPTPEPVKVEPKTIHEDVFYVINKTQPAESEMVKVERVAKFMNDNPDATITVKSYADAGTGNAKINKDLAQKRSDNLKKTLVEKYGIDGSRITATSFGDTVQPFTDNDSNRVSIVAGTTEK